MGEREDIVALNAGLGLIRPNADQNAGNSRRYGGRDGEPGTPDGELADRPLPPHRRSCVAPGRARRVVYDLPATVGFTSHTRLELLLP
jgi:hypothetical protein